MFDPKKCYEDRTPPPLKEAPRDHTTRPTVTPESQEQIAKRERAIEASVNGKRDRQIARQQKRPKYKSRDYQEWKRGMELQFGRGWRKKWLKLKRLGVTSFKPGQDNYGEILRVERRRWRDVHQERERLKTTPLWSRPKGHHNG